ncbi:MAG: MarR family transcriptional regulator [Pseudohongiellaceae bacterium]|nr:MarR family transcriptional regulator [Pseudohongiellaceae bacterium]
MSKKSDSVSFQVFNEIGIIHQLASSAFESALPDGLKLSQFTLLNHCVRLGDGNTPAQLASAFQVTKGAMTNTVNRLLTRGLVKVLPDPVDGRSKRVYITPEGLEMREQCLKNIGPVFHTVRQSFSEEEFEELLPLLKKLRILLDESR